MYDPTSRPTDAPPPEGRTLPLTTPGGLRLDPVTAIGTLADAWEGGIYRVVAYRGGGVHLLTLGYGFGPVRRFASVADALMAIDAEQEAIDTLFGTPETTEVAHG